MTTCTPEKKGKIALFISLAVNFFLIAFLLGQWGDSVSETSADVPVSQQGVMSSGGGGVLASSAFGLADLFKPDDMRIDEARMRGNFDKMYAMRKDFAEKLRAGAVTKEDVIKHFNDMDQVRGTIRDEARGRAADRICNMTPLEREEFAEFLMKRGKRPFFGNGRGHHRGYYGNGMRGDAGFRGQGMRGGQPPAPMMAPPPAPNSEAAPVPISAQ